MKPLAAAARVAATASGNGAEEAPKAEIEELASAG
jgi:hypothetical protein